MGVHKTEKPIFPKEFIWPAKMIHIATDTLGPLAAFPQNAAQTASDPAITNNCSFSPCALTTNVVKHPGRRGKMGGPGTWKYYRRMFSSPI